jgi:WD repeat-containing protein 19
MHWTKDGSIMSVTTSGGYFFGFLTVVPHIFSAFHQYAAILSSLTEVSVIDCSRNNMIIGKADLEIEPQHISIGPDHFAVGINDSVWYYRWRPIGAQEITTRSIV